MKKYWTLRCLGVSTVDCKMPEPEGKPKDAHTMRCLGVSTVDCKMPEGEKKQDFKKLCHDGGASTDGRMPEGEDKEAHVFKSNGTGTKSSDAKVEVRDETMLSTHLEV